MKETLKETFLKLIKHSGIYSISEIASRAVGFLLIPLYTRYLTPADYGVLEVVFITQTILLIVGNQGISSSLFRFWSDTPDEGKRGLASSCLWYEIVSAVVVALAGILLSDGVSRLLFATPRHGKLFRLIFVSLIFSLTQLVLRQILRARLESLKVSAVSLAKLIIAVALNIYLIVVQHMGLMSIVVSDLISSAVSAALAFWFARRFIALHFSWREVSKVIAFGFPLIWGGLSNWVLSVSDRYFLAHYSTETELGLYSLAYKFSGVLALIMLQPFLTTWPSIYFDAAKRPDAKEFFARAARYFALVFSLAGVALFLASNVAIKILSPPQFWGSTQVVYLLVGSVILEGLHNIFVAGLFLEYGTKYPALFTGVAAAVNLVLNLLLIPPLGMQGAAIATLVSYAIMVYLTYRTSQRFFPVHYPWKTISGSFIAFLAIGWASTCVHTQGVLVDMFIACVITLTAIVAAFFSPMITPAERSACRAALETARAEGVVAAIRKMVTVGQHP